MGKWLQKFLPETPVSPTAILGTLPTVSSVSVPRPAIFANKQAKPIALIMQKTPYPRTDILDSVWSAEDWRLYHDERAARAHEGGLSLVQAEQQAFRECIGRWLAQNPDCHADPDTCPQCGKLSGVTAAMPSMQFLNAGGWPLGVHDACMQAWCNRRRQAAITALAGMGIIE